MRNRNNDLVVKPVEETGPNVLADGWAQLNDADWEGAHRTFTAALAREETPEALEGLSWAAWWLDDADAVFAARERAFRLYRERDSSASAARMAIWLACDQLDFHGAVSAATGWLQRARRLLDPLELCPEHGWLAFHEGYVTQLGGNVAKAGELGTRAADIGQRFRVPDLEMLGLAMRGAALVAEARVGEGMRCLEEATAIALAGEATVPISGAWTYCFLVTACTSVLDFERAFEWCDRIAEFADRYGSRYMLAFCRADYGGVQLSRGDWKEAERMLEASVEDFSRSRPAMVGGPLVTLAELRRRQGRLGDAAELLDRAGSSAAEQLCRARIALDAGQTHRSTELAQRVLRQAPAGRKLDRVPALDQLVRAHVARGELEEAGSALESLREIEALVGTDPVRAHRELAEGMLEAAGGDHERARILLEDSVDRFERCGAPFEAALSRIELALSLAALGRGEAAAQEASAARERLQGLGASAESRRADRVVRASGGAANADDTDLPGLTPREREVLALVAQGLTNRQIAERLIVSEHTVHRHVTNTLRKLDLPSRTAAAARAASAGLLGDS